MQITTLPVYSKLADPNEVAVIIKRELPVQLSQHGSRQICSMIKE